MRLESRARATRKIFGIASRAREWGAKGRAIVSWVRRVEVIVGNVDRNSYIEGPRTKAQTW